MDSPLPHLKDSRAVKVAGIDVIHSCRNRLSKHRDGFINITGRSPHLRTGESQRAIAHTVHSHRFVGQREGAAKIHLLRHSVPLSSSFVSARRSTFDNA